MDFFQSFQKSNQKKNFSTWKIDSSVLFGLMDKWDNKAYGQKTDFVYGSLTYDGLMV